MKQLKSKYQDLMELFLNFQAKHISEELQSYPGDMDSTKAREEMKLKDFDVMGVQEGGTVCGYICKNKLGEGLCRNYLYQFKLHEIIADTTPILDILPILKDRPRLFVLEKNLIKGIVTRGDLQKTPVRMLLFSLISLTEMHFQRIISIDFPNDSWKDFLDVGRLKDTQKLMQSRIKRNENIGLLDCLQLLDKIKLVQEDIKVRDFLKQKGLLICFEQLPKINKIRHRIAHSQDLVDGTRAGWVDVIDSVENLRTILAELEKYPEAGKP